MERKFRFLRLYGIATAIIIHGTCWAQPPIKVACIGNSVTFGYGLKVPGQTSYPAVLQQRLRKGYTVRNFGHSGATLLRKGHNPYVRTRAFADALAFAPDIAIIHLGLNDTDPRNWPDYGQEFESDYAALIDTFRRQNPALRVFICRLTPIFAEHRRFLSGTRDWYGQIQERIPRIAQANSADLIDLHAALYQRPDLFADALHPDEEGAALIAGAVYSRLTGNYGGLQLASVLQPHMVVQRGRAIPFWGKADRGTPVVVQFAGTRQSVVADAEGNWQVSFPARKAGGPFTATISTTDTVIDLQDILCGDVWLCSGQSNMAFPLRDADYAAGEMLRAQNSSRIRLLNYQPIAETDNRAWDSATLQQVNKLHYFKGSWQVCDSLKAKGFSAIAYAFAQNLQSETGVPIGLVQVAVGGSTTESWIGRQTLAQHPILVNELVNWRKSDFFQPWVRERADTNLRNSPNPKQRHPYDPAYNYEAGISSLTRLPVKGVLWYQGESNTHNVELHQTLLPVLVNSWRNQWSYTFPFLYVQLSSLNRPSWPLFRYSQKQLLQTIPKAGMAVSSDLGHPTNVHPRQKMEVGRRLALHQVYGRKRVAAYGPELLDARRKGNDLVLRYRYAKGLRSASGKTTRGFEGVDAKGRAMPLSASIRSRKVVLALPAGITPTQIRYGWQPYTDANLVNGAGLPASTDIISIK